MNAGNACNREVITADKHSSVTDVARLMRECHVGSVIITERNGEGARPVGIITDRDLVVEVLAQEVSAGSVVIADLMTPYPVVANEDDPLEEVIDLMRARGARRMPVVDGNGYVVGVIAMDDLLSILSRQLNAVVSLIGRQQRIEARHRPG